MNLGWKTLAALALACAVAQPAFAEDTLKVGVAAEPYPPFTVPDASGNWSGWEIDMMNAICEHAKLKCVVAATAWDGIIPALTSHKIDMIMSSMSINAEREKTIDFSNKYYNTLPAILAAKDSDIKPTPEGLKGKILGVQVSTTHESYAKKYFGPVVSELKIYQTQDEANQDLAAGRIDALQADSVTEADFLKSDQGKCCKSLGAPKDDPEILGVGAGIGLRKGETALKDKLNAAIKAVRADGTYDKISKKYFDFDIYGG